jgi:ActR/RegA family two-component response regulator
VTLLLLDDDATIVAVVKRYFAGRGWEVEACLSSGEALSRVASDAPYDAVICDLHFTPARLGEGLQILERAHHKRPEAALLLFTGAPDTDLKGRALELGAREVLTKPTPLASLHEAVLRAMRKP